MPRAPVVLLINPWITDFAAYDLWAKPLGLLLLGALLRQGGCRVYFIDCLQRHDPDTNACPGVIPGRDDPFGTGKYPKMPIPVPEVLAETGRPFFRYGIHPDSFLKKLGAIAKPDLICVTSLMTYWYPGVRETIAYVREVFPEVPVWLGGIYARLCPDHARKHTGADRVVTGTLGSLAEALEEALDFRLDNKENWRNIAKAPPPALDFIEDPTYVPILLSLGCPYRCPYCASSVLHRERVVFDVRRVFESLLAFHEKTGVRDVAFYDDALLVTGGSVLQDLLQRLDREGLSLRFHTPNALHVRALTDARVCRLLFESGFTTVRLGLETTRSERHRQWGGKADLAMFYRAVEALADAGFAGERIGVYLLAGVPGQTPEEVAEGIALVKSAGMLPFVAEFSPIPGTAVWRDAVSLSAFPLEDEPLTHNNSFFACRRPDFTVNDLESLKRLARHARRSLRLSHCGPHDGHLSP